MDSSGFRSFLGLVNSPERVKQALKSLRPIRSDKQQTDRRLGMETQKLNRDNYDGKEMDHSHK